ncbi:DNA polymerase III subunit delta [uncultured Sunxiuqinia sp.]|uniref:DNA polymerase III subunit n=1 Tax=uncultured Sunxiuqinia sp. TaxID=1573825 RepID=UPI0030D93DE5
MFFQDVIGQEATKKRLIQSVKEERISHAQLFAGPEGSGKLALALAYAQYISCLDKQNGDSCGHCSSCKKYAKLIHPDLHFVFPVVKTPKFKDPVSDNFLAEWRKLVLENAYFNLEDWFNYIGVENAQGLIYSHESEEILRKLNLKSFEAEYKVMIIWMPEKMHVSCSNKLLKMIEEPPVKTLFLLVTESEEEIITTIRSRCQLIKIPGIQPEPMKAALQKLEAAAGKDVDNLVHLSRGNYRQAINLLELNESTRYNLERFKELMRFSYGRKFLELFQWINEVSGMGRERQKIFLQYAMGLIRENFVYNLKNPALVFMHEEEQAFSARFSPFINERNIVPISEELEKAYQHIAMNGNPRIILTDMSLKIVKLIRK